MPEAALYADDVTPIVNDIIPDMGSTVGGDLLTITGENLGDDPNAVSVLIDGIPCNEISASPSEVKCLNGAR